jgi:hypothetical protein
MSETLVFERVVSLSGCIGARRSATVVVRDKFHHVCSVMERKLLNESEMNAEYNLEKLAQGRDWL